MEKLNFLTAGMPLATGKGSYPEAFDILRKLNLDGMEMEFVHGVRISDKSKEFIKENSKKRITSRISFAEKDCLQQNGIYNTMKNLPIPFLNNLTACKHPGSRH